jgi:uncharacterized cupredoxin-like copper-binding protein
VNPVKKIKKRRRIFIMKKIALFTLVMVFALAFLAACGGGEEAPAAESGGQSIDVVMNDIYYGETPDNAANPPVWTIKTGGAVSVSVNNKGTLDHNWAIVKAGETIPDTVDPTVAEAITSYDVGVIAGGDTYNSAFTAPAPGEYTIICTVAGHYPAMQGKLVVEP